jgi:antibiotic biosynthesis monooxygenase (ABM) superfamily enzyme
MRTPAPATVVVTRRVRPGREAAHEDWLKRLLAEAESLEVFLMT